MDYNKSMYFDPVNNKSKQAIKKQYTIQTHNNANKRKSDDIHFYNFLSKFKHNQKYKINKIPINHRFSFEDKDTFMSNLLQNLNDNNKNKNMNKNKNKLVKRDSKYYVNLVNGIYSNDSHLSNKNVVKNSCSPMNIMLKKIEKKKTCNFSKRIKDINLTKKSGSKNSKKKVSIGSNDIKNKSDKKLYNCSKSSKKCNIASNENEKTKKFLNDKNFAKYHSTKGISKFKKNENSLSKNKTSRNPSKKNSAENVRNEITDIIPKRVKTVNNNEKDKTNKNEIKKNNKNKKVGIEVEKCDTNGNKIIANNSNISKRKKNYKCLFCCFNNNNSLSDNE